MSAAETAAAAPAFAAWARRVRFLLAIGLIWGAVHLLSERLGVTGGWDRPALLVAADGGLPAAILIAAFLCVGAFVAALVAGARDGAQAPLIIGLALIVWSISHGTMDDWLIRRNTIPAPPTSAPYFPLLAEYLLLTILMLGATLCGALGELGREALDPQRRREALRQALDATAARGNWRSGVLALATTTVVAALLIAILTGPRAAETRHGQVLFAVIVAFSLATLVARRVSGVPQRLWYWPAPILVGVFGVLLAIWRPALPGAFSQLDMIPPWPFVRPLPVQMLAAGLVAIILTARSAARLAHHAEES